MTDHPTTSLTRPAGATVGLGVDAGGTYTDAVLLDLDHGTVLSKAKAPTTPHDLSVGVAAAIARLDQHRLAAVELVALSTTLATNAIVEGRGSRVGLLLMPWNARAVDRITARPVRIVPGRQTIDGLEVDPVEPLAVAAAVRELLAEGCEAFAVSGYAGTHNPHHELAVAEIVRGLVDHPVVCGHELSAKLDFIRRAHTAVLNAQLLPTIGQLLDAVTHVLATARITAPVFVVRGDGSLLEMAAARRRPIDTLLSGPAASAGGARFLTGDDDLLAVDIGGTTTDLAIVTGGRISVCPDGPTVGDWTTAVAAVDILTSGLGGDSYVKLRDGGARLDVGPERVIPLSALAARYPEVGEELAQVAADPPAGSFAALEAEHFELVAERPGLRLSPREQQIVERLRRGPASRVALAHLTGAPAPLTVPTGGLEQLGVIRRAALTPTDALHVLGRLDLFDAAAARAALTILGAVANRGVEELAEWICRTVERQLAYQIIRREWAATLGDPNGDESSLLHRALHAVVEPDLAQPWRLAFSTRRTIVGIGAPAAQFLPAAGARLGATVVVPEHAEVANAVGAVTGKVTIRATATIRPETDGGFRWFTPSGPGFDEELRGAEQAARESLVRYLRERAAAYGTDERHVKLVSRDRSARLSDGSDFLIALHVEGTLEGAPRLAGIEAVDRA